MAGDVGASVQVGRMTTLKTMTRVQLGAMGEALAVDYLTSMGLRILNRNWRCRYGELDVIACDAATRTVVFQVILRCIATTGTPSSIHP